MKVLLINGSRRDNGCTFTGLSIIAQVLNEKGIETQIFNVGSRVRNGELEQAVNEANEIIKNCDALVVGSPVYYASPSGELMMFLDRFFSINNSEKSLCFKPAAAISSCRRAGNTATLDVIYKYFAYNQMPIVSSRYWNEIHGSKPEDVLKDEEGVQVLKMLGTNMAWLLKSIQAGKSSGVEQPVAQEKIYTNFIS